jgi:DnaJ-domain-containing protein 1
MTHSNIGEPRITQPRVKEIIAALARPEPLPNLSSLCPEKKELTRTLLYIARGLRSPYYADLREAAELQHLDVRDLTQKAEFLLALLSIASSTDFYSILEVDQHTSSEEIHHKWIEQMRLYHPDMYETPAGWIAQQARRLNEAYAVLKDPEKRREYDVARRARGKGGLQASGAMRATLHGRWIDSPGGGSSRDWLPMVVAITSIALASLFVGVLLWSW